jgi:hypothetical protein
MSEPARSTNLTLNTEQGSEFCELCEGRLIEMNRYGERLTGCVECNQWLSERSAFVVELSVEEIVAIKGVQK